MPENPSPRLSLLGPSGGDPLNSGDDVIRAIIDRLEAIMPRYETGAGTLPASGVEGRFRYQSDVGVLYFDTGVRWRIVGGHTGALSFTLRAVAPAGYIFCVGQPITNAYPELRTALVADGSPFGADASGNPRLPPTPSRALVATGSPPDGNPLGLTEYAVGAGFGEERHRLTTSELASHTHAAVVSDPGHFHEFRVLQDNNAGAPGNASRGLTFQHDFQTEWVAFTRSVATGISVGNLAAGANGTHETRQPSVAVNLLVQT